MSRPEAEIWHVEGRSVGPFALGAAYLPAEHHVQLKRYIEEDFDTFTVEHIGHSKVGVADGVVRWVLCGRSFCSSDVEHFGLSRQELGALYAAAGAVWASEDCLQVTIGELFVELLWVKAALRWVNVTLAA